MILAMVLLLIIGMFLFFGLLKTYKSIYYYFLFFIITLVFIISIIVGINGNVLFSTINFKNNVVHIVRYLFIFTTVTNLFVLIVLSIVGRTKKVEFTYIYFIFTIINILVSTVCTSKIFLEEDVDFIIKESYGSNSGFVFHHLLNNWYFILIAIICTIAFIIYEKRKNKYFIQ